MSLQRVAGKIAIVTGAASGIGSAVCSKFASEGARVVFVDRDQKKLESNFDLISKTHENNHHYICGDVSESSFVEQIFENIKEKYDSPADILVNCAGIFRPSPLEDMTEESYDEVLKVNLKSAFLMTKAFITPLKQQNHENASIVNISSVAGKCSKYGSSDYVASKWGLIGFTKRTGLEMGKFGIRCNAILPGLIKTPLIDCVPSETIEKAVSDVPLGRIGVPEDIANVCLFLASDESSYVNCATLEVSGGLLG